jgi:hypothetical protein
MLNFKNMTALPLCPSAGSTHDPCLVRFRPQPPRLRPLSCHPGSAAPTPTSADASARGRRSWPRHAAGPRCPRRHQLPRAHRPLSSQPAGGTGAADVGPRQSLGRGATVRAATACKQRCQQNRDYQARMPAIMQRLIYDKRQRPTSEECACSRAACLSCWRCCRLRCSAAAAAAAAAAPGLLLRGCCCCCCGAAVRRRAPLAHGRPVSALAGEKPAPSSPSAFSRL